MATMTTWVFEGTVLPAGDAARVTFGPGEIGELLPGRYGVPGLVDSHCHLTMAYTETGPAMLGEHPEVLATPAAVVLNDRRVS
jgi:imidazolonepropionase-like amidohydrolase